MSRGQINETYGTASDENKAYNKDAQTSFNATQGDIDTYGKAVGSFQAANPYVQGGGAQVAEDQEIADTSAGQAQRLGQALQGSAVRGGQNPGAAIAAGKEITAENTRAGMGAEAGATAGRIAAGTGYAEAGLSGLGQVQSMQDKLATEQGNLAEGALNTEQKAGMTPSFGDELGQMAIKNEEGFSDALSKKLMRGSGGGGGGN